jgi:hypothetical protein
MVPSIHFVGQHYAKAIRQNAQELSLETYSWESGVACVVPQLVDKIKVNLDFQIFDDLDLDLLLGSPVYKNF